MSIQHRLNYFDRIDDHSISLFFSGQAPQKSSDQNYPFVVNRNFYYLTGISQERTTLVLIKSGVKQDAYLFIDPIDPVKSLWDGKTLSFEEAAEISGIPVAQIKDSNTLENFISGLLTTSRKALYGPLHQVFFDLEKQNEKAFDTVAELFAKSLRDKYTFLSIHNNQYILAELRMIKDQDEVQKIQKAIDLTKIALEHVVNQLKPGLKEYEIEAEYNYVLNKHRVLPSFDTIAASGKNATVLHYVDNNAVIKKGDLILFDLGISYDNYCSDISRTYPANGKFSKRQKEVYQVVLDANKQTIDWLKAGKTLKEFNEYGRHILIEGAKKIGLIEKDEEISKYYYHGLGHYLGLDVHDVGNHLLPIPEGAILTVEPGLYIADEGIGIRIEDNILITKDGAINLSHAIIKEIKDIESAFLNNKK